MLLLGLGLTVLAASCGGQGLPGRPSARVPAPAATGSAARRSGGTPAGAGQLSAPGCTTAVRAAPRLPGSAAAMTAAGRGSAPFGVAVTADSRWAFVSLGASVGVFRLAGATPG